MQGHDLVIGGHLRHDKVVVGPGFNTAPAATAAAPSSAPHHLDTIYQSGISTSTSSSCIAGSGRTSSGSRPGNSSSSPAGSGSSGSSLLMVPLLLMPLLPLLLLLVMVLAVVLVLVVVVSGYSAAAPPSSSCSGTKPQSAERGPKGVSFGGPGRQRLLRGGGNVWQHLRSFRKRLFDAVPDEELRKQLAVAEALDAAAAARTSRAADTAGDRTPGTAGTARACTAGTPGTAGTAAACTAGTADGTDQASATTPNPTISSSCNLNQEPQLEDDQRHDVLLQPGDVGYYYDLANDWAFMVPMAELATNPGTLPLPLYLYEPSLPHQGRREAREAVIGKEGPRV